MSDGEKEEEEERERESLAFGPPLYYNGWAWASLQACLPPPLEKGLGRWRDRNVRVMFPFGRERGKRTFKGANPFFCVAGGEAGEG